jgi:hypothetical protein
MCLRHIGIIRCVYFYVVASFVAMLVGLATITVITWGM